MDIKSIIKQMTVEEKAAILSGTEFWKTNAIPRLDIPALYMSDGPIGLRKQGESADHLGINKSEPTTSFPTGVSIASSWNIENAKVMGEAIANECHHYGVNVLLGPAVNIKRNPRCGRNFEYYSEDPYLSGKMGIEFTNGVQNNGIGVSVKHFAANNNENYRFMGDSLVDERAFREVYLKAFEMIVKESKPTTVMCAYNKINGTYCSENKYLLTDILREEWGYDGLVVSDWGAVSNRVEGIKAGMDLEMPGDCFEFRKNIIDDAKSGKLSLEDLDRAVHNMLNLISKTSEIDHGRIVDYDLNNRLSAKIATDCAVLLKNSGSLPLNKDKKYLIIGDLFAKMRYQGAGSSMINPTMLISPKDAFDKRNIKYDYVRGYRESEIEPEVNYEEEAIRATDNYDEIVVFVGQTDYTESEGYDRDSMMLPKNQLSLMSKLAKLNKKIIIVLFGGSPVELPFEESVDSILNMYLPGQGGGEATAELLFGEKNPSGKLAETWPITYKDVPFGDEYINSKYELYKDSIYVGYRYYDKVGMKGVRYPFGFGLSYTQFHYSNINIKEIGTSIQVSCDITNIGKMYGGEVVQLYVENNESMVFKATKELRDFTKVYLNPGEKKNVTMSFSKNDLAYYNVKEKEWVLENGEYGIIVAASIIDSKLCGKVNIYGQPQITSPYDIEEVKNYYDVSKLVSVNNSTFEKLLSFSLPDLYPLNKKVTLDSPLTDFNYSLTGRILYKGIVGIGERQYKKALIMPEGPEREMEKKNGMFLMRLMPNNCVRAMAAASSGKLSMNMAQGFVEFANGNIIKAIKYILLKG